MAVTGHHARLGTRLRAKLCRGHYFERLNSISFQGTTLHGSGRAGLPHPALALGDDAHAAQGIRMTDSRQRQPAMDEAPHTIPKDAAVLAAPRKCAVPEPPDLEPKDPQRVSIHGHSVVTD